MPPVDPEDPSDEMEPAQIVEAFKAGLTQFHQACARRWASTNIARLGVGEPALAKLVHIAPENLNRWLTGEAGTLSPSNLAMLEVVLHDLFSQPGRRDASMARLEEFRPTPQQLALHGCEAALRTIWKKKEEGPPPPLDAGRILAIRACYSSERWVRAIQSQDNDRLWRETHEILLDVAVALGARTEALRDYKDLIELTDHWWFCWVELVFALDPEGEVERYEGSKSQDISSPGGVRS